MEKSFVKKNIIPLIVLGLGVFIFIVAFYTHFHPFYIFDTDDWTYIAATRVPLPDAAAWNPTRILPEVLMPLTASLGVWLTMPFTHSYTESICWAFAIVVGILLSVYFVSIFLILKKGKNKTSNVLLVVLGLLLLHFLPMGEGGTATYMLYSSNVTCVFYYTISALWNAILVMYAIRRHDSLVSEKDHKLLAGFVAAWAYFAINSNLFQSIIIAVYGGVIIFLDLIKNAFGKNGLKAILIDVVKKDFAWLLIVIVWLGSCWFEINGGRSASLKTDTPYLESLKTTIALFINTLKTFNKIWIYSLLLALVMAMAVFILSYITKTLMDNDKDFAWLAIKLMLSAAIAALYLVLLCAKAGPGYITRMNVQISWMFFAVLLEGVCFVYVLNRIPNITCTMPLILCLMFYSTVIDGKIYSDTNISGVDTAKVKAFDEYVVESVVDADKAGNTDIELRVPEYSSGDNWPLALYGGDSISNTLYVQGLTNKRMNITFIPEGSIDDILNNR